jgi:hypothetical protein
VKLVLVVAAVDAPVKLLPRTRGNPTYVAAGDEEIVIGCETAAHVDSVALRRNEPPVWVEQSDAAGSFDRVAIGPPHWLPNLEVLHHNQRPTLPVRRQPARQESVRTSIGGARRGARLRQFVQD